MGFGADQGTQPHLKMVVDDFLFADPIERGHGQFLSKVGLDEMMLMGVPRKSPSLVSSA
jgi:hypothetical protein